MPEARTAIRLLRHATLLVEYGGRRLLVDPMLGEPGSSPPIENTPNERRNPLVPLPTVDLVSVDAVVVTHLHNDHFDDAAKEGLPKGLPVFCQPPDAAAIEDAGFGDVRPVNEAVSWSEITITRTGGRHGHDELAEAMAPVSGFVFEAEGAPTLFVAGDTVWCPELEDALASHDPDAVVLNAGGARFVEGEPITMTDADVAAVCRAVPDATVIAVHLEAINHCLQTRANLRAALDEAGVGEQVVIPEDGSTVELG